MDETAAQIATDSANQPTDGSVEPELMDLDSLDDFDFDLDEVENKIAPLALASWELGR
jgi:hypothetical protein